jgi:hypothetical protein
MALKSADGRHPVCCEQALKSVGERNTHGGCRCGGLRETARAKEVTLRGGGFVALLDRKKAAGVRPLQVSPRASDAKV